MDYMLDIIIPRDELKKIRLFEVLREWGGEMYSSTPAMYVTDSNIEFMEVTDLSYYNRNYSAPLHTSAKQIVQKVDF